MGSSWSAYLSLHPKIAVYQDDPRKNWYTIEVDGVKSERMPIYQHAVTYDNLNRGVSSITHNGVNFILTHMAVGWPS